MAVMRFALFSSVALGVVAAFVACVGDDPGGTTTTSDGGTTSSSSGGTGNDGGGGGDDASSDAKADAGPCDLTKPFSDVTALSELNGSTSNEGAFALSKDELSVVLASTRGQPAKPAGNDSQLWFATRTSPADKFGTPSTAITANLNLVDRLDNDPTLSEDGLFIIYTQRMPAAQGEEHLFRWSRRGSAAVPFPASSIVTFGANDAGAAGGAYPKAGFLLPNGALYFAMMTNADSAYRVQRASPAGGDGKFDVPVEQKFFDNQPVHGGAVVVTPDENTMYIGTSIAGSPDLEIAVVERSATGGTWGEPKPLVGVNSGSNDYPRWLSPDQCRLYFASDRDGNEELYVARRK